MARADTVTLLALDRYAQIMGINPAHFNQGARTDLMPIKGSCSDVWFQYAWQTPDRISREDIAYAIEEAEYEIAEACGFWPAPKWIDDEMHQYPRHHRRTVVGAGRNVRSFKKGFRAKWGKFIQAGQRQVDIIGDSVAPVYSTEDGDLLNETATVTVAAGDLIDPCEIKVYFEDMAGDAAWEIRPARTAVLSGANFVLTFWAWQFILPATWEALTTEDTPLAVDFTDAANLVTNVDVYREYTDFTERSAQFYWENEDNFIGETCSSCSGAGCAACELTTQDGCIHVRDVDKGIVVPVAATYDDDDAEWEEQTWTDCREPDQVKIWYYAGDLDNRYLGGHTCDPLSNFWAQTIAWLATARIERPFCACPNVQALANDLRTDMAFITENSYLMSERALDNPFGTRKGEVQAWRRISKFVRKRGKVAVF
jgi:hypothetical protein